MITIGYIPVLVHKSTRVSILISIESFMAVFIITVEVLLIMVQLS